MNWHRHARLVVGLGLVAIAIVVGLAFKGHTRIIPSVLSVSRSDPNAIVESASGRTIRINREREEIRIDYEKLLTYQDGSTKMLGVKVVTERAGGRTFTITGKEGQVGEHESNVTLVGDVQIVSSDGMTVRTDRATYAESDGIVHAPGLLQFERGRMKGSGSNGTWDKTRNVLTIAEQVAVHMDPDERGAGALQIDAGTAEFDRMMEIIQFGGTLKALRGTEAIDADSGVAHLTSDEQQLDLLELRGHSRVTPGTIEPGGLRGLEARDIDVKYGPDGQAIEHAILTGGSVIQLADDRGRPGRRINGERVTIIMAADGVNPQTVSARDNVELTLPAEPGAPGRAVAGDSMDAAGEDGKGLTAAHFSGNVRFREKGTDGERTGRSGLLDIALAPAGGAIEEARFLHAVRFEQGDLRATAANARYVIASDRLELSGSEPGVVVPHVENGRIQIDASQLDVTLTGPRVKASGSVKSVLRPAASATDGEPQTKLPTMLKQDLPVNVTAATLEYDGAKSLAVYTGSAQLWQGDTTIKGSSITLDDKNGDLAAEAVATRTLLIQRDNNNKEERVVSVGNAKAFNYKDAVRRATYSGEAHLTGPQGELTASKIEVYLKESGDEIDHLTASESVGLREQNQRKTTGSDLTYFGADERYIVSGAPVKIVDQCGRETTGRTLTFYKATDRIVVDGKEQGRTQSKGKSQCP